MPTKRNGPGCVGAVGSVLGGEALDFAVAMMNRARGGCTSLPVKMLPPPAAAP